MSNNGAQTINRKSTRDRTYFHFKEKKHPENYRQEYIRMLSHAIDARENRLVVSLPGMGTSNLLRFLVVKGGEIKRQVTFAYLDCYALGGHLDVGEFFEAIAKQFYEQGVGRKSKRLDLGYSRMIQLVTGLQEEEERRLAIVVDNANKILAKIDNSFYENLKALTNLNKGVCFIFAVSPHTVPSIDPEELLFAGRQIKVGPLDDRDCEAAIIEEERRLRVSFNAIERKRFAFLSGGCPGLLRALSTAVVENKLDLSELEEKLVERLVSVEAVKARCQKLWNELDSTKQAALKSLATHPMSSVASETVSWLRTYGLVDEREEKTWIFSPIFRRFVDGQEISALPHELVRIEGMRAKILQIGEGKQEVIETGTVLKGEQEVKVSLSELRLIACLLREPRVNSRDEIANSVWPGEEGHTNQQIDGLVAVVRKKLGDSYIETYPRQGYKFVNRG